MKTIEYNVELLPEDSAIRGNAMASDDADYDKEVEDELIKRLESGDEFAWCLVKVTATIEGISLEGTDYLGCVSVKNSEELESLYIKDMQDNAKDDLLEQIKAVKDLESGGIK